jgi:hypothetical protein
MPAFPAVWLGPQFAAPRAMIGRKHRRALTFPFLAALVGCSSTNEPGASGGPGPALDGGGDDVTQTNDAQGASDSGASQSSDSGAGADTWVPTGSDGGPLSGPVSKTDVMLDWKHWNYALNSDNTIQDYSTGPRSIVDQMLAAIVLENDWVKVTLLPEVGGRVASIFYKPTGHEELYLNPVGAPYGYMSGAFFYNWLMVYGGISPTLPEAEHGKAWLLPWSVTVTDQTPDHVSVKMSFTDNIDATSVTPSKFNYGNTGIQCDATVTLYRDRSSLDFAVQLTNTRSSDVNYEYWTCTTLAPGSDPSNPNAPGNTEIIAPISQIQTNWGGWLSGPMVRPWDQSLSLFSNWQDMGIIYAYPAAVEPFWGVINHDAHEGIFRIAENSMTPGLKMWTWGYQQSQIDPTAMQNAANGARPYIELWGGVSHQFFTPTTLAASASKQWTESFLPTVGLDQVTAASADGAAHVFGQASGGNVTFAADFFSAHPGVAVTGTLSLDGQMLGSATLTGDPRAPLHFEATKSAASIAAGSHQLAFVAQSGSTVLLSATTTYTM